MKAGSSAHVINLRICKRGRDVKSIGLDTDSVRLQEVGRGSERATVCRTISGGPPWLSLSSSSLAPVASTAPVPFSEAHHLWLATEFDCLHIALLSFFGAFIKIIH